VTRPWDELACPECGVLNVVVLDGVGHYIMKVCEGCGKEVEFVRDPWSYGQFLDRIKKHRKFDPGKPF
jgi:transcription elongation factor Elf1